MKDLSDRKLENFIKKGRLSHEKNMDRIVYHNSVNKRWLYPSFAFISSLYCITDLTLLYSTLLHSFAGIVLFRKFLQRCSV